MKTVLSHLIDDFHERKLPELVPREKRIPELKGKANIVVGMRRSGKTFFCYQRMQELAAAGVPKTQMLYLNFEDDRLLEFTVTDFQAILDVYYGKYPAHREAKCHFFLDEIQRIPQWEIFIRRLLDTENVHVYLTGSSSKLLSTEIATSLRGRSLSTEIFPYSFQEFFKAQGFFSATPATFGGRTASLLRKAIADYLSTGGFPEVLTAESHVRVEVLQGYIDSVLLRDVIERHKVSNVMALKYLARHIMNAPGGKMSINRFYNTLKSMGVKCTKNSLYEYLDHLCDAYLFYKVPIHSRSEKARLLNPAKIYTIDTGLLNATTFRNTTDLGPLLENMVFMHLRRHGYEVEYLNTSDGYEVDFFARNTISGEVRLIQACWEMSASRTFEREQRALLSAMQELSIPSGIIVTWDDEASLASNIETVPVWKWLSTFPA